jgi:hypothetical protein
MTLVHKRLLAIFAALLIAPATARAQGAFSIGIGPSFPIGNLGSYASTGFNVLGAFQLAIPYTPVAVRFDGAYDQFSYDHIPGNAHVFSGTANAVYSFRGSVIRPYAIGGFGLYHAPHIETVNGNIITSSDYAGGINGGIGARIGGVAGLGFFTEFRFHYVFTPHDRAEFFPLTFGITF